jgi:pimeloyl-ACP methyl ester carboxylesterase
LRCGSAGCSGNFSISLNDENALGRLHDTSMSNVKTRPLLRETRLSRLADLPTQILWGSQDEPGFRQVELMRWQKHLQLHETEVLDDASHFVQEDRPDRVTALIFRLLERTQNHRDQT